MSGYVGIGDKAEELSGIFVSVNDKAKRIVNGWVGVDGKAQRFYTAEKPSFSVKISVNAEDSFEVIFRGEKLSVDWGDGTVESVGDSVSSNYQASHTYNGAGEYTVTIYGVLSVLAITDEPALTEILTPIPKKHNLGANAPSFSGCTSLTTIPNGLFDNCPGVTSFSGIFGGCTSLSSIPAGLFDRCLSARTFANCFSMCTSLAAIPSGLFDNCTSVGTFGFCFNGCTGITSAVPELWNSHPNASGTACFYDCTQASNYADIPSNWK